MDCHEGEGACDVERILTKCCYYTRLETRLKECTNCASRGVKKPVGVMKVKKGWKLGFILPVAQPGGRESI